MLTTCVIKNTDGAAQYYSKEDNYYLSEVDAKEASMWLGEGAAKLGLRGKVEEKTLHDILSGKLPNGSIIGLQKDGTINHRPGHDLCFQAPKSISILALDGEDKRLYDAHLDAIKETLKVIERDCAQAKVYKNKQLSFENTNNLTIALIAHTTSRKLDLHLHHHALVMNCTQKEDGSWRALASNKVKGRGKEQNDQIQGFSERIYNHRIYYGLIYQAALANRVVKLGYAIETVGPHGMWEIKGVPKEARDIMSKRRKEIESKLKDLNYRSLKAADTAALDTREKKPNNISLEDIKQSWKKDLSSVSFVSKEFIAAEMDRMSKKRDFGIDLANVSNVSTPNSAFSDFSSLFGIYAVSTNAKEAVYDAIEHLSQYNLKLDYSKIATCALEFSIGHTTHKEVIHALEEVIKKGDIIPLDKSDSLFVTKTLIETEKAIMNLVSNSKGSVEPVRLKSKEISRIESQWTKDIKEVKEAKEIKEASAANKIKELKEIEGIKERCMRILQSKDRLHLIEHMASDNKEFISFTLALAESSGKTVRVLSPNRMMTHDINENIKRRPNTLWQWLVSLGKPEVGECVSGFLHKYQEEIDHSLFARQDKDVFIVNNAETLGGTDLKSLLELTAKTNARVIFLRDTSTRQGFCAGNSLDTLKQAGIETEVLKPTSYGANATNKTNEIDKINKIPEVIAVHDDADRTVALAKAFAAKDDKERENTLVLVGTKSQIKSTNEAIRCELRSLGKLSAEEYRFSVLNTTGLSKTEKGIAHKYQNNMVVRFYTKGEVPTTWSIDSTNRDNNTVRLRLESRVRNIERISWNPKNHKESNYSIFKREVLGISQGDKLIATAKMSIFGINQAEKFTVTALEENYVELLGSKSSKNNKTYRIGKEYLKDSHFDYDYATTLSKCSQKAVNHVIADFKAYVLDKPTLNDLNLRTKESLTIFTNNEKIIHKRFGIVPVKLTGAETVLKAAYSANQEGPKGEINPERIINDKTISEIKGDIDEAINALSIRGNNEKNNFAANKAVDYAIEKITSHKAGFTHKELVAEALTYALKDQMAIIGKEVTHEEIVKIITEKHQSGELVMGKYFEDGTRWTTKDILATERSIIARLKAGIDKLRPLLDERHVNKLIADSKLTDGQKNACRLIATTKDQFVIVQGYAGTGKTTMFGQVQDILKEINNAINDAGDVGDFGGFNNIRDKESKEKKLTESNIPIQMLALAPTHKAVKELKKIGIEAQTLKSFLLEQQRDPSNLDNKLIVLDENSMVSNKDFDKFLDLVKDSKVRGVLCGDIAQHIAIGSGKPFEIAYKSNVLKVVYLREIVRQESPALKSAVEDIIRKDYESAFEKIAAENPKDYIAREKREERAENGESGNRFFSRLKCSIVEIDNNELKHGQVTIEKRVAEDYLTRTPETREKTVVIVHSNHDRRVVADLIRNGLKEQGEIDKNGIKTNCLVAKGLTDVEYKSAISYSIGDIVKIGKEYYKVDENDPELKGILLKSESGKARYFYPEKDANKYNIEVYECIQSELAVGDTIRLTKTDKDRERYANFEYLVEAISNKDVTLKSKDTDNEYLILKPDNFKDAHWDYAYTVTGYGIQGGSKPYVIDFEVSYRKNLSNQRSFYIGASRAIQHLIIYTDNRNRLLDRIIKNKGDKYSALDIVDEFGQRESEKKNSKEKEAPFKKDGINYSLNYQSNQNSLTKSIQVNSSLGDNQHANYTKDRFSYGNFINNFDFNRIEELINSSAELFIERILGKPNPKLSTLTEWRYGNKGSLAISMSSNKKGLWHNFETGESGNLVTLTKKETGLSFKETLEYAAGLSGIVVPEKVKPDISEIHKKTNLNLKTSDYAVILAKESIPIQGTIVERYLRDTRGIKNLDLLGLEDVRYHPSVYVGKGEVKETQKYRPAMIAIGRDKDDKVKCVQATYLDPKTLDKANIDVKKRTYSSPAEAAVVLNKYNDNDKNSKISYITEGIETGLSIKDAIEKGEVLVTLGKSNFTTLDPAKLGQKVVFCLDNDGKNIYRDQTIYKAAERLIKAGKEVYFTMPRQINNQKTDFNDVIKTQGVNDIKNYLSNIKSYDKADKKIDLSDNLYHKNQDKDTNKYDKNKSYDLDKTNISIDKTIETQHKSDNFIQKDIVANKIKIQRGFEREL